MGWGNILESYVFFEEDCWVSRSCLLLGDGALEKTVMGEGRLGNFLLTR